jgi:hypothetical protein
MEIREAWTAAAVLGGFQIAAYIWRLNREIEVHRGKAEGAKPDNWLPPSDYLSLLSLLITTIFVFAAPTLSPKFDAAAVHWFGLSVILFAGYPWALFGHYGLLFRGAVHFPGKYCTVPELLAVTITAEAAALYVVVWLSAADLPSSLGSWPSYVWSLPYAQISTIIIGAISLVALVLEPHSKQARDAGQTKAIGNMGEILACFETTRIKGPRSGAFASESGPGMMPRSSCGIDLSI